MNKVDTARNNMYNPLDLRLTSIKSWKHSHARPAVDGRYHKGELRCAPAPLSSGGRRLGEVGR